MRVKILLAILALVIVGWLIGTAVQSRFGEAPNSSAATKAAKDKEDQRIAIAATFAKSLQRAMRDPDSFKLNSVLIVEKTGAVCYEYRSRNGFNGMTVGTAVLSPTDKFKTNEMDGFTALWNRECAHHPGKEEVSIVSYMVEH